MGGTDRIIRTVLAIAIAIGYFTGVLSGTLGYVLLALAAIFLLTSVVSFCPLYRLVGLSTCKVN